VKVSEEGVVTKYLKINMKVMIVMNKDGYDDGDDDDDGNNDEHPEDDGDEGNKY
jgi:hypothetical protein